MIPPTLVCALGIVFTLEAVTAAPATTLHTINWIDTIENGVTSKTPGAFSISQVPNPHWTPRVVNYTDLYVGTLRKFKNPIPKAVYADIQPRDSMIKERQFALTGYQEDGL